MRFAIASIILGSAFVLTACGEKPLHLLDARKNTPDEFLILPSNPIEQPADYAALPTPTPGGVNLADRDPRAEALVALGGRPSSAIPASDGGLIASVSRFGVTDDIRSVLVTEDESYRRRNGRFTRLKIAPTDRYARIYERMALDPYEVSAAYRRAGVPTPSAPPEF